MNQFAVMNEYDSEWDSKLAGIDRFECQKIQIDIHSNQSEFHSP